MRIIYKVCISTLASLMFSLHLVKAETSPKVETPHKVDVTATGSLNKTNSDFINIYNTGFKYGYKIDKADFNLNSKWVYGSKETGLINNDFNLTIDGNLFHDSAKRFNSWILGSFLTSYSLNIENQYQIGTGVAWKLLDIEKLIQLRISNGIVYEESNIYNNEGVNSNYATFRNSFRLQMQLALKEKLYFKSIFFWQPSLESIQDKNINTDVSLEYKMTQRFSLISKFGYNYVSRTAKENLIFTYGFSTSFAF